MTSHESLAAPLPPAVAVEGGFTTGTLMTPGNELSPLGGATGEFSGGLDTTEQIEGAEKKPKGADVLGHTAVSTLMDNEGLDATGQSYFDREFNGIVENFDADKPPDDGDGEVPRAINSDAEPVDGIDIKTKGNEAAADTGKSDVKAHAPVAGRGSAGKGVARGGGKPVGRRGGGRRLVGRRPVARGGVAGGGTPGPTTLHAAVATPPPRPFEWFNEWYGKNNTDEFRNTRWVQGWSQTDPITGLVTGRGVKSYTLFGKEHFTSTAHWLNFINPYGVDMNGVVIPNRTRIQDATIRGHGATSRYRPSMTTPGDRTVYDYSDKRAPEQNRALNRRERAHWATLTPRGWRTNTRKDGAGNEYRARSWLFSTPRNNP